jgi:hypothetical protein
MDSFHFRPRLTGLEDRLTPAVSPIDVFVSLAQTYQNQASLQTLAEHITEPRSVATTDFISAGLQVIDHQSVNAASVLGEFAGELQQQAAVNPMLSPMLGSVRMAQFMATMQDLQIQIALPMIDPAAAAALAASKLPPPPPVAPPPPPAPSPALSTTMPSLTDSNWSAASDGLRTWDVTQGTGAAVQPGDTVSVNYIGWLASNGTKFDASADHGSGPSSFSLNNVIKGWQEGIPGMKVGGIRRLDIPANLAYGAAGNPPSIPANAELVFEIQLVSIGTGTSATA